MFGLADIYFLRNLVEVGERVRMEEMGEILKKMVERVVVVELIEV